MNGLEKGATKGLAMTHDVHLGRHNGFLRTKDLFLFSFLVDKGCLCIFPDM